MRVKQTARRCPTGSNLSVTFATKNPPKTSKTSGRCKIVLDAVRVASYCKDCPKGHDFGAKRPDIILGKVYTCTSCDGTLCHTHHSAQRTYKETLCHDCYMDKSISCTNCGHVPSGFAATQTNDMSHCVGCKRLICAECRIYEEIACCPMCQDDERFRMCEAYGKITRIQRVVDFCLK
jgi:hypothetical protein